MGTANSYICYTNHKFEETDNIIFMNIYVVALDVTSV